ncbi:MAG: FAD-dependent oxidoreductase [Legionella sp.]|jgi:2-octaprenylphenol hydroxylase
MHKFDVLVIGGGIVGLSAALAMAQRDYSVAILDAGALSADTTDLSPRVYAINQASHILLQDLGAWQFLETGRVSSYNKMYVWDAANGAHIDFDSRYIAENSLGFIIEESVLKKALLEKVVSQKNISLFANSSVDEVEESSDGISISAKDKVWQGNLLLIADGAHSPTREKLHVKLNSWSYNQTALVANVKIENKHHQTAYQVFNSEGPLAFLPLVDEHHCSIVWSTTTERATHLMALDDKAFNEELTKAFHTKLGQVEVSSKRYQFPLRMRHVNQYSGEHWLLLGDAAHTVHPLAGLGLNLGLADVSAWIDCISSKQSTPRQLKAYQRQRKHAVWQTILLLEGFKRLFGHTSKPISLLRGLGLSVCNQLKPLKRLFIEHAEK